MNKFRSLLAAIAVAPVFMSGAALAGMPDAAGTLLSDDGLAKNDIVTLVVLAVVAIAVVVYLRKRKSK